MADGDFRAAVLYENLADLPTTAVRASSAAPFLPPQLLRDPHIGRKWRGLGNYETLFVDLGEPAEIDTVALVGCNVIGTMRVRGSATVPDAEAGLAFDHESASGDLRYGYQIALLPELRACRYLRIDLQTSQAPVQAGRLVIGRRHQFSVNFGYGWQMQPVDPSRKVKAAGGSTHIDRKRRYRVLNVTFDHISEAQRWGFVEDLDMRVGGSTDVLMLSHPLEVNHGQRAIWGLMPEPTPTAESFFQNFSKTYTIEERL